MEKIYISGPITGTIDSVQRFIDWATKLKVEGWKDIINPVELDHTGAKSWRDYMKTDTKALRTCQYIVFQPRWWLSRGCWVEWVLSKFWGIKRVYIDMEK